MTHEEEESHFLSHVTQESSMFISLIKDEEPSSITKF
jgi:hypothetical protein